MTTENTKKGLDPRKLWEWGKKISSVIVVLIGATSGLYATYLKPETEARASYRATKSTFDHFSDRVDDRVAHLQGRVDTLEKLVFDLRSAPVAAPVATGIPPEILSLLISELAAHPESEADILDAAVGAVEEGEVDDLVTEPPAPIVHHNEPPRSAGLKTALPDAPWEQKAK